MIKNTVIALVAAASIAGMASPAFAEKEHETLALSGLEQSIIVGDLQAKGINATSVENWGTMIRAYVTTADGSQVMQYFQPDTLQPALR